MKDLIVPLLIAIGMGTYALLAWRIVALQRKNRDLERDRQARALLRLADKPYMLPKQQDHEIQIIKRPADQRELKICERVNTSHRQNGGKGQGNHDS